MGRVRRVKQRRKIPVCLKLVVDQRKLSVCRGRKREKSSNLLAESSVMQRRNDTKPKTRGRGEGGREEKDHPFFVSEPPKNPSLPSSSIAAACCKQRRSGGGRAISFGEGRGRKVATTTATMVFAPRQQQQHRTVPSLLLLPLKKTEKGKKGGRDCPYRFVFFAAPKITLLPAVSLLSSCSRVS